MKPLRRLNKENRISYNVDDDKYCYPGTCTFINKFGITDQKQLEAIELEIVPLRLIQLNQKKLPNEFSPDYLKQIHWFLFQDLYDWAGKYRKVRLFKEDIAFAYPEYIEQELTKQFSQLKTKNNFLQKDKTDFCHELAILKAELNLIHPFRDGNGRSIRKLIEDISSNAGFSLLFDLIDHHEYILAMKEAVYDVTKLEQLLYQNIIKK